MPKYRTIKQWLYQPAKDAVTGKAPPPILYPIGAEVEFNGPGWPSETNLEPIDAAAKAKMAEANVVREKERRDAKLKAAPAGLEMLAALAEALQQVKTGNALPVEAPRAPIATDADDHRAAALSRATSSHGRKHAAGE